MAIEVDDRPRLAEVVDSDRHHPCAEHGPEPRQRVAGGIVHGDDRQAALVAPQERRQRVAAAGLPREPPSFTQAVAPGSIQAVRAGQVQHDGSDALGVEL